MGLEKSRKPILAPAYLEGREAGPVTGGGGGGALAAARAWRGLPWVAVYFVNIAPVSKGLAAVTLTNLSDTRNGGVSADVGNAPDRNPAQAHLSSGNEVQNSESYEQPSQTTRYFGFGCQPYCAWDHLFMPEGEEGGTSAVEERAFYWGIGRGWNGLQVIAGTEMGETGTGNDNGIAYLVQPKSGTGNAIFYTSDGVTIKSTDTGVDLLSAENRPLWHDIEIFVDQETGDWVCALDGIEVARHVKGVDVIPIPIKDVPGGIAAGDDYAEIRRGHVCDADNDVAPVVLRTKFYRSYTLAIAQGSLPPVV